MKPLPVVLVVLLALSVGIAFVSLKQAGPRAHSVPQAQEYLVGGVVWGMSPAEVESIREEPLTALSDSARYYAPASEQPDRYRSYERKDIQILGRPARAVYTFFDEGLFAIHVFLSDSNSELLDEDVRRYLTRLYGSHSSPIDDATSLKMVWQFSDRIVNYWFFEEEFSLRPKYTAAFGIIYKPPAQRQASKAA